MNFNFSIADLLEKEKTANVVELKKFDPENHEYFFKSEKRASVSQILQETGISGDYSRVSDFYKNRGIAGHKMIELWHNKALDEDSIHKELREYYKSFLKFVEDNPQYEVLETEKMFFSDENGDISEMFKFAGTVDEIAKINGELCIIDNKFTSTISEAHFFQLGAYMMLAGIGKAYIRQIRKDGYSLVEVPEEYIDNFKKILDIFFSDMKAADKKEAGIMLMKKQLDFSEIRAKSYIESLVRLKQRKDEIEAETKDIREKLESKLLIEGFSYNGKYENETMKVYYTKSSDSVTTKYEVEKMLKEIEKSDRVEYSKSEIIDLIKNYKKDSFRAGSYRLITYEKDPENIPVDTNEVLNITKENTEIIKEESSGLAEINVEFSKDGVKVVEEVDIDKQPFTQAQKDLIKENSLCGNFLKSNECREVKKLSDKECEQKIEEIKNTSVEKENQNMAVSMKLYNFGENIGDSGKLKLIGELKKAFGQDAIIRDKGGFVLSEKTRIFLGLNNFWPFENINNESLKNIVEKLETNENIDF